MLLDLGWRGLMVAVVVLIDLVVFADLAREELSELRAKRARRQPPAVDSLGDRRHAMAGRAR